MRGLAQLARRYTGETHVSGGARARCGRSASSAAGCCGGLRRAQHAPRQHAPDARARATTHDLRATRSEGTHCGRGGCVCCVGAEAAAEAAAPPADASLSRAMACSTDGGGAGSALKLRVAKGRRGRERQARQAEMSGFGAQSQKQRRGHPVGDTDKAEHGGRTSLGA
jgi:hypothetical protein